MSRKPRRHAQPCRRASLRSESERSGRRSTSDDPAPSSCLVHPSSLGAALLVVTSALSILDSYYEIESLGVWTSYFSKHATMTLYVVCKRTWIFAIDSTSTPSSSTRWPPSRRWRRSRTTTRSCSSCTSAPRRAPSKTRSRSSTRSPSKKLTLSTRAFSRLVVPFFSRRCVTRRWVHFAREQRPKSGEVGELSSEQWEWWAKFF